MREAIEPTGDVFLLHCHADDGCLLAVERSSDRCGLRRASSGRDRGAWR